MGWFWGASSSSNDKSASSSSNNTTNTQSSSSSNISKEDAFKNLDPSLKDYLKKSTPSAPQPPPVAQAPKPVIPPPEAEIEYREPPHAQSQYGDRYADLWSTYRPGGDKLIAFTPAEKIRDFVDDYTALKGEIRDAAIENCAFEQLARHECWMNGSWRSRMSMCSAETHELERCLEGQAVRILSCCCFVLFMSLFLLSNPSLLYLLFFLSLSSYTSLLPFLPAPWINFRAINHISLYYFNHEFETDTLSNCVSFNFRHSSKPLATLHTPTVIQKLRK